MKKEQVDKLQKEMQFPEYWRTIVVPEIDKEKERKIKDYIELKKIDDAR